MIRMLSVSTASQERWRKLYSEAELRYQLPEKMREEVGYMVKDVSDKAHQELTPDVVYRIFEDHYISAKPIFSVDECHLSRKMVS